MFENLSSRLDGVVKRLRGKGRLTDADVDEMLREIRTALLEADVNVGVVRNVTARIREHTTDYDATVYLRSKQAARHLFHRPLDRHNRLHHPIR